MPMIGYLVRSVVPLSVQLTHWSGLQRFNTNLTNFYIFFDKTVKKHGYSPSSVLDTILTTKEIGSTISQNETYYQMEWIFFQDDWNSLFQSGNWISYYFSAHPHLRLSSDGTTLPWKGYMAIICSNHWIMKKFVIQGWQDNHLISGNFKPLLYGIRLF